MDVLSGRSHGVVVADSVVVGVVQALARNGSDLGCSAVKFLCTTPYQSQFGVHGCGKCTPCLIQRRRLWTHRIMLENVLHADSAFVTLTYADEHLPVSASGAMNLEPAHLTLFLKKLRSNLSPMKLRYYAVGEYGDEHQRPHFHLAAFGLQTCLRGDFDFRSRRACTCDQCQKISDIWGMGRVHLGTVETKSAQYVARYTVKKMTHRNDPRLGDREPEFSRKSLKPGLGADAAERIAETIRIFNLYDLQGDVPSSLQHGKKILPLGKYMRDKVRVALGKPKGATQATMDRCNEELLPLRIRATSDKEDFTLKKQIVSENKGRVASFEAREKIFKQKGSL